MRDMKIISSPLRYPGGKSKAIENIMPLIPRDFEEYREPFIGGASIFLSVKQRYPDKKYWINDLYKELFNFWKVCQENPEEMMELLSKWKKEYENGKMLQQYLRHNMHKFNNIELASAYLVKNRTSFSGFEGGFSEISYHERFTKSNIESLRDVSTILKDTYVTNFDYSKVVENKPRDNIKEENVFIFCCLPETKIRMHDERLLNIENINIGDKTFLGGNVLNNIERNYKGYIYEFEVMGIYENLSVTEEHPLAVIKQERAYEYKNKRMSKFKHQEILNLLNIEFLMSKNIRIGDFLLIPCYPENIVDIKTVKIGDIEIKCNEDFGWILGFWLAEGCIEHYHRKGLCDKKLLNDVKIDTQRTLFDIDNDEEFDIDKLIDKNESDSSYILTLTCGDLDFEYGFIDRFTKFTECYFKETSNIYNSGIGNHAHNIRYHIEEFAKFLFDNFGEGAGDKKLPNDILNYPIEFQKGLLRGWIDGDGGILEDENNRTKITGTSISKQLALDMYQIGLRLGLKPAFKSRKSIYEYKNKIRECIDYDTYFSSAGDIRYLYPHIKTEKDRERTKRKIITKGDKKFILTPITNIIKKEYNGNVYNLSTENHVYVANYLLNHNCDPPYYNVVSAELYGKKGTLHHFFSHQRFANTMKHITDTTDYKWLITYDDSNTIRKLFDWANKIPWELKYSSRTSKVGKEIFITNMDISKVESKQLTIDNAW